MVETGFILEDCLFESTCFVLIGGFTQRGKLRGNQIDLGITRW
jgi:hypothetical protein